MNLATAMNLYPKNSKYHSRSSILSYRVWLDPVVRSYFVVWIERTCNITSQTLSNCINTSKEGTPNATVVWNPQRKRLRLEPFLEANWSYLPKFCYSLSFMHVHQCWSDKTAPRLATHSFLKKTLSYALSLSITENTLKLSGIILLRWHVQVRPISLAPLIL